MPLSNALAGLFADVEAYKAHKAALASRLNTPTELPKHLLAGMSKEQTGAFERWMGANDLVDVNYLSRGMAAAATVSSRPKLIMSASTLTGSLQQHQLNQPGHGNRRCSKSFQSVQQTTGHRS
jgi:hypothetical protein